MKTKNTNLKFGLMSICAVGVAFLATQTGCTTSISQGSDGSWTYDGELVAPPITDDGIIIRTLDGEEK